MYEIFGYFFQCFTLPYVHCKTCYNYSSIPSTLMLQCLLAERNNNTGRHSYKRLTLEDSLLICLTQTALNILLTVWLFLFHSSESKHCLLKHKENILNERVQVWNLERQLPYQVWLNFFFYLVFLFLQRIGLWVFIKYYHLLGEKFHDSQKGNNLFHFYDHLLHGAVQVVNSQCVNTLFNPSLQNHDSHVKQHDEQDLHTSARAFSIFNHHHHHHHHHHHTPIDANKPTLPQ